MNKLILPKPVMQTKETKLSHHQHRGTIMSMNSISSAEPSYEQSPRQPSLIEMLDIFNAKKPDYVSTLDFLSAGVLSPAAGISRLKASGAIIETETRTVVDRSGKTRKRIACYRLAGWV